MQIVWDQEVIKKLKNSHTVLELETFDVEGTPITAWCVVPAEKIGLNLASLDGLKDLHAKFVEAWNNKEYNLCQDISRHLMGQFGGELDTFYEEILQRINNEANSTTG